MHRDTLGHAMPRPVPAGCVDTTPAALWEPLWEMDPDGAMQMPTEISDRGKRLRFWKGFGIEGAESMPRPFWHVYWRRFPEGHPEDAAPRIYAPADESKYGYFMCNGRLQFRHPDGRIFTDVTGTDVFPNADAHPRNFP